MVYKIVLFAILLIFPLTLVFSQNTKVFTDAYGITGQISSSSKDFSDSILPQSGKYSITWRELLADTLITFRANGNLRNHLPQGKWVWEEAGWDYSIEPGSTIAPNFKATGIQHYWDGNFQNGIPDGTWIYSQGAASSRPGIARNNLFIQAIFRQGYMNGLFTLLDDRQISKSKIAGSCNSDGVVHGKWVFEYTDSLDVIIIEEREYDQGILIRIKTTVNNSETTREFNKNQDYLLRMKENCHDYSIEISKNEFIDDDYPTEGSHIYSNLFINPFFKGWKLDVFPFTTVRNPPIFRRFCFPLSESEFIAQSTLSKRIQALSLLITNQLQGGNMRIIRTRNSSFDLAISIYESSLTQLERIDSLLSFSKTNDFLFLNRYNGEVKPWMEYINAVNYAYAEVFDTSQVLPTLVLKQDLFLIFDQLEQHLERLEKLLLSQQPIFDENFLSIRRENELATIENRLAEKLNTLDSLYQARSGLKNHIHAYWISDFLFNSVQRFARTDEFVAAMELGKRLEMKMDSLILWSHTFEQIDNFSNQLDAAYLNYAYNPYTGAYDIELPLKRRFVNAIKVYVIPHIHQELIMAEKWNQFEKEYSQTLLLRSELIRFAQMNENSDRRLERRIRKESNPEKMIRQFLNYMVE